MTPKFKPMLAYTVEDTSNLTYPLYASVKLDGIRVVVLDGVVYSRSMKPIRSKAVQELFGRPEYNGLDGEVLYGDWTAPNVFNLTTQTVMATEMKPEFSKDKLTFAAFDYVLSDEPFNVRQKYVRGILDSTMQVQMRGLLQIKINDEESLLKMESEMLDQGYEGLMVRAIDGRYKQGRSTAKEGIIGKIKRFSDDEAVVIGFEEKMTNENVAYTNELGRTQRSQALEGMIGAGTLGALVCECKGIRFTCGSGLDEKMRKEIWDNKEKYIGKFVKFKHFEIGQKNSFRFPIWLGFRDEDDL